MRWFNEPTWTIQAQALQVTTADQTDFWRQTHYGFTRDSGHFLFTPDMQEFTVQVRIQGRYQALYDQAGLMVRSSPECWVKAGVEFVGEQQLSAVVTREFSDWNVRPVGHPAYIDLKATRRGDTLSIQSRLPDGDWSLLRLADYPSAIPAAVGIYACSPQRGGFEVHFSKFRLGPPDEGTLY